LSAEEQSSIIARLVKALKKLHSIWLGDKKVKEFLDKTLYKEYNEILKSFKQPSVFRGPYMGFLNNGVALLGFIIKRRKLKKPFDTIEPIINSRDIRI
jgi:hypothetical protein